MRLTLLSRVPNGINFAVLSREVPECGGYIDCYELNHPQAVELGEKSGGSIHMAITTTTTCAVPDALFRRIQGEFLEMPGLCLTQPQACRLWGLDRETCGTLLSRLVDAKFLTRTRDGAFIQLDRTQQLAAARRLGTDDLFVRL
jgi:hypothetical protein